MDLVKGIAKKSVIILVPAAMISALIETKKLPAGILIGGLLGYANIRGLAWGVRGLLGSQKASGRMIIFSMLRLFILFAILSILIYLRLVNVFGLLIGFTIIFGLLIIEGLRVSRTPSDNLPQ